MLTPLCHFLSAITTAALARTPNRKDKQYDLVKNWLDLTSRPTDIHVNAAGPTLSWLSRPIGSSVSQAKACSYLNYSREISPTCTELDSLGDTWDQRDYEKNSLGCGCELNPTSQVWKETDSAGECIIHHQGFFWGESTMEYLWLGLFSLLEHFEHEVVLKLQHAKSVVKSWKMTHSGQIKSHLLKECTNL